MRHSKWTSPERLVIFGLLIALVFTTAGFEIASATTPTGNSTGTATFCYKNRNGSARIINPSIATCSVTKESTVTLRTYDPIFAKVSATGVLGTHNHATAAAEFMPGEYNVTIDQVVSACAAVATPDYNQPAVYATATAGGGGLGSEVIVYTMNNIGQLTPGSFSVVLTC